MNNLPVASDEPSGSGPTRMGDFERGAALVLAQLYEAFPVPMQITPSELEKGVNPEVIQTHAATVEFLAREGYLRHGAVARRNERGRSSVAVFAEVTLTAKGLAALNATPRLFLPEGEATVEGPVVKPLGKRLAEAVRQGASSLAGAVVRTIITEGVKGAMG